MVVSVGAASVGQVVVLRFVASVEAPQGILCLLNDAKMAAACGVPFARLPSSSRAARSQIVSPSRYDSQWTSLPHGPLPLGQPEMNPSGVDGVRRIL